ncbi:trehalase family glycosidase [Dongia mobilis]|uniref:MGH1-like glycoside hydrolase domain-containing protein n=1 Tax=Dongia sp. TaxID=1977262 RepID=UPI0026F1516F
MTKSYPDLPPARHWNSWQSEYPAQMMHLPLGLTVAVAAYSGAQNSFTDFPANKGQLTYGPRDVTGRQIGFTAQHAGTVFDWRWDQPVEGAIRGAWVVTDSGEWGLRFWLMPVFAITGRDDITWQFDPASGVLSSIIDGRHVAAIGDAIPLIASFHDSRAALAAEFEREGYFFLGSRGTEGRIPALRYNLDETPTMRFAVAVGATAAEALTRAKAALAAPEPAALPQSQSLDAIRDIVGWNSVHDFINDWPYMSLSRTWVAQKFGGFGLWLDDIFYHALASGLHDTQMARENIKAVLDRETPEGNLACLLTGRDSWIDRSQLPVCSLVLWKIWQHTGADDLIELGYRKLLRNHDWWFSHRDGKKQGLMGWGTSAGVGDGLYKGTKLGAKNESTMDNSPLHDDTIFDPASGCLDAADVGLNSILVVDAEVLAAWARSLGDQATADRLLTRANTLRARIGADLWDDSRQIFANRRWSGDFVRPLAPTSFYPLLAGAADARQQQGVVAMLNDPRKFGGKWRLPSITRDDPAYHDNVYWRGRVWPPLNYLTYQGLKRAGLDEMAEALAVDSGEIFSAAWTRRQCPENFSAETGHGDDQPDTDLFYGWGALMPVIAVNEVVDVTPWHGWELTNKVGDQRVGPLNAFNGRSTVIEINDGRLSLALNDRRIFTTDIPGRFRHVEITAARLAFEPPLAGGRVFVPGKVGRVHYGAGTLAGKPIGDETVIDLPAVTARQLCVIELVP